MANEMIYQKSLSEILSAEFSCATYSLGKYLDDAVCLEKAGDSWEVYTGYRGRKNELSVYDNIVGACLGVIEKLTVANEGLRRKLNNQFADTLVCDKIA